MPVQWQPEVKFAYSECCTSSRLAIEEYQCDPDLKVVRDGEMHELENREGNLTPAAGRTEL